jgi:hypothetical protein
MAGFNNAINNSILDIAGFGISSPASTTQVAVTPTITGGAITTGMLVNPFFAPSSGTLYGEQLTPAFNPPATTYPTVYGLAVSPTITPTGTGTITTAYGVNVAGPTITSSAITTAYSLYVTNASGAGAITNNYTAILGINEQTRVGIGNPVPQYMLHVSGAANATNVLGYTSGITANNQLLTLAEGYNQGGFGGGMVGTNKMMNIYSATIFSLAYPVISNRWGSGMVYDGRYLYFAPQSFAPESSTALRYDTLQPFSTFSSYTIFDLLRVNGPKGCWGDVFDGRYVYYVPFGSYSGGPYSGTAVQYDTTQNFLAASSYTSFNLQSLSNGCVGFVGAVFDGRYVYFVPNIEGRGYTIVRFDSTLSFTASSSFTTFSLSTISASTRGFHGGVFDGRYVYLVPGYTGTVVHGTVVRYDTTGLFTASSSFTCFDMQTAISTYCTNFFGGVFDGRYVYFVPSGFYTPRNGTVTRYDTTQSFTAAASYTTFNLTSLDGIENAGFMGGVFDGRYIYLTPYQNSTSYPGTVIRYDTTGSFNQGTSYTGFDFKRLNANASGYGCCAFDGRYVYFAGLAGSYLARLDTYPGPQAKAMAAYQAPNGLAIGTYAGTTAPPAGGMIVRGNVGIGTSSPAYALDVNGTINAASFIASNIAFTSIAQPTANNQKVTLFEGYNQGGFGGGSVGTNKAMSANATIYDLSVISSLSVWGGGGVFDGRYIYIVPSWGSPSGTAIRYDTTQALTSSSSYTTFDIYAIGGGQGFFGGVFDGRYIYYVPFGAAGGSGPYSGTAVRYDTTLSFTTSSSFTSFNFRTFGSGNAGYVGAVFDGRYIYFVPNVDGLGYTIIRYDSTLSFTASSSFTTFTLSTFGASTRGFNGGVYDGRYVYFVPAYNGAFNHGTIVRYDTTVSFTTSSSFSLFDMRTTIHTTCRGFCGGVFDGRYIYYVPTGKDITKSGTIVRYDTAQPFSSASSYLTFFLGSISSAYVGYKGGVFDGRYVYYVPGATPSENSGTVLRYDTLQPFTQGGSYTAFDLRSLNVSAVTYTGGVFDGRYVYFIPATSSYFARLDAYPGPQATAMAANQSPNGLAVGTYASTTAPAINNLIVSGNVGIGTSNPAFTLDVNGSINATAWNIPVSQITQYGTRINQTVALSQGYNQGGFGGGSVGTNKTMSLNTTASYDTTNVDGNSKGFLGAIFDGRFIYFVPFAIDAAITFSGQVTRYDATAPFDSSSSYAVFDTTQVSAYSKGFAGAIFDGRYIYLAPNRSNTWGTVTRYDTLAAFNSTSSYTIFNTANIDASSAGFWGGVFDGRYVYFVPNYYGTVTRYDTLLSFTANGSWTCFGLSTISNTLACTGGVFDGRYIYFVPYSNPLTPEWSGTVARFDTSLSFRSAASYTVFNLTSVSSYCKGFNGAVFDGRFVYFVPQRTAAAAFSNTVVCYDTQLSFTVSTSYQIFDLYSISSRSSGFNNAVFDGRFVYYVPYYGSAATVVRYDTTQAFSSASSYTIYDAKTINSYSAGFASGTYDGKYLYLVPYYTSANGYVGRVTRIAAYPGPDATAIAASQAPEGFAIGTYAGTATPPVGGMIVSGNVGIGTSSPAYTLDVNGTINASFISGLTQASQGTTLNNQILTLSQGYNQGGYGGGSVGTNPQMNQSFTSFDMTYYTGFSTVSGGLFDGRYIYFLPHYSAQRATIYRYDTTLPFNNPSSFVLYNTQQVDPTAVAYWGGVYDGRYIYLVPTSTSSRLMRYDTTLSFIAASSYSAFDLQNVSAGCRGFKEAVFDGRYIYFVPNDTAIGGTVTRYDTLSPSQFSEKGSYTTFDLKRINGNAFAYLGGAFDGRYVYFIPEQNGYFTRYDTSLSFTAASSFTTVSLVPFNTYSQQFWGGVFDGRYVYLVSYVTATTGLVTRYDSTQSFTSVGSYTTFDLGTTFYVYGSRGAIFDGRYIYFVPGVHSSGSTGTVARFDTTQPFTQSSSYTTFNVIQYNGAFGSFSGAVYDGHYIYFTPYSYNQIIRITAYPGPKGTAIAANQAPNGFAVGTYAGTAAMSSNSTVTMIISGKLGIGLTTPTFTLQINPSAAAGTDAGKPSTTTWTVSSDQRIKRNIQDMSDAISVIRQLHPRQYTFHPDYAKDLGIDPGKIHYGFVADEVENVLEGCVRPSDIHCYGGKMRNWYGNPGTLPEPIPELKNLKTFDMHNVLMYGIQAVKELNEQLQRLQKQFNDRKKNRQ